MNKWCTKSFNILFLLFVTISFSAYAEKGFFSERSVEGSNNSFGFSSENSDFGGFLRQEEAFVFSSFSNSPKVITLKWFVVDGYYLYKKDFSLQFASEGKGNENRVIGVKYPVGKKIADPKFGEVEVFSGDVNIEYLLEKPVFQGDAFFEVTFRGCAKAGLCYPKTAEKASIYFSFDKSEKYDVNKGYFTSLPNTEIKKSEIKKSEIKKSEIKKSEIKKSEIKKSEIKKSEIKKSEIKNTEIKNNDAKKDNGELSGRVVANSDIGDDGVLNIGEDEGLIGDLKGKSRVVVILTFFLLGLLSSFTGCSYPLIPIMSSIIVGSESKNVSSLRGGFLSIVFVLMLAITYGIGGVVFHGFGINLSGFVQSNITLVIFSAIFAILALSLFGVFEIRIPAFVMNYLSSISQKQKGGAFWGVAIMGCLSALMVGSCATPILAGAFLFVSQESGPIGAWVDMFFMGLGTGIPLIVIGFGLGVILPKVGDWMDIIKKITGFVLLAISIYFLGLGVISPRFQLGAFGVLLLIAAGFVIYSFIKIGKNKIIVAALLGPFMLYGLVAFSGAIYGGSHFLKPFEIIEVTHFTKIYSINDFNQAIASKNKKAIVRFSAENCPACRDMDVDVYSSNEFKNISNKMILLEVDLSLVSDKEKMIMDKFNVVAAPTVIFFNKDGSEKKDLRVVGYLSQEKFFQRISSFVE